MTRREAGKKVCVRRAAWTARRVPSPTGAGYAREGEAAIPGNPREGEGSPPLKCLRRPWELPARPSASRHEALSLPEEWLALGEPVSPKVRQQSCRRGSC